MRLRDPRSIFTGDLRGEEKPVFGQVSKSFRRKHDLDHFYVSPKPLMIGEKKKRAAAFEFGKEK